MGRDFGYQGRNYRLHHIETCTAGGKSGKYVDFPDYGVYPAKPRGKRRLQDILKEGIEYPEEALLAQVKGKVVISFSVFEDGKSGQFEVIRGIGHGCEEEVIKALRPLDWLPPISQGRPFRQRMLVEVDFAIQRDGKER